VTAAWIAILVIAVGLPLAAWWLGSRPFWAKVRGADGEDLYRYIVTGYGLSADETRQVQAAMTGGRALADPRLRAAVANWAGQSLALLERQRNRHPTAHRLAGWLLLIGGLLVGAGLVVNVLSGDGSPWLLTLLALNLGLQAGLPFVMRRNLVRAVELNSGVPTGE
jgi:hypothetical protein